MKAAPHHWARTVTQGPPSPCLRGMAAGAASAIRVAPSGQLSLCPTSGSPLEAPLTGQDAEYIQHSRNTSIGIFRFRKIFFCPVARMSAANPGRLSPTGGIPDFASLIRATSWHQVGRNKRSALRHSVPAQCASLIAPYALLPLPAVIPGHEQSERAGSITTSAGYGFPRPAPNGRE